MHTANTGNDRKQHVNAASKRLKRHRRDRLRQWMSARVAPLGKATSQAVVAAEAQR